MFLRFVLTFLCLPTPVHSQRRVHYELRVARELVVAEGFTLCQKFMNETCVRMIQNER